MISKNLLAASTKPIILVILKMGENYGYQIIQQVREISGGDLDWSEPMLYPVLKRMEQEGLIKAKWKMIENKRFRRYYRLTEAGRAELEKEKAQWMTVHAAFTRLLEATAGLR
jgi:PadR family transcriptional regulator, regulatory protein PadR